MSIERKSPAAGPLAAPSTPRPWAGYPVPVLRQEARHGDRLVRCFADRPASLYAMFAASVAARPEAEAVVCNGQRWTYADAAAHAVRTAAGLATQGVQRGDRVVVFVDNRPEFVWLLLALQRLGAVAVPVGVREQRPGLAYIVRQCGAMAIVADAGLTHRLPDASEAPELRCCVLVDDGSVPGATHATHPASHTPAARQPQAGNEPSRLSLASLLAGASPGHPLLPPEPSHDPENDSDTAVILYTSGTTGHPKGAMLTHANLVHSVLHYQACMRLGPADRSALVVPASHVTGLVAVIATMLHVGGSVVIAPPFKAESFIALMAAEKISHTMMVPAVNDAAVASGLAQ